MTEMNTTEHVISNDPGFEKMTLPEMIFGVGFGSFGIILFMQVVAQFNTFLTEYMGMRPYIGILGTIVLAAKTIEILTGLIMGYLIDKKSTRHGRTRHFLLIGALPFLIAGISIFFMPDNLAANESLLWFTLFYSIFVLFSVILNTARLNLVLFSTKNQESRTLVSIIGAPMMLFAGIIPVFIPLLVINMSNDQQAWKDIVSIMALVSLICILFNFIFTKERVIPTFSEKQGTLRAGLRSIFTNRYWLILFIFNSIISIFFGMSMNITNYYAIYILGDFGIASLLGLTNIVSVLVGMAVIMFLIRKFDKRILAIGCFAIAIFGSLFRLLNPSNLGIVMVSTAISSVGVLPTYMLIASMSADAMEYGVWKSGLRKVGFAGSIAGIGASIGAGLGPALANWTLQGSGFALNPGGESVQTVLVCMSSIVPVIVYFLAIILFIFFDLERKYKMLEFEYNKKIRER